MNPADMAAIAAVLASAGAYLILTAFGRPAQGRSSTGESKPDQVRRSVRTWMVQAGLSEVSAGTFIAALAAAGMAGALGGYLIFDSVAASAAAGILAGAFPLASYRRRRQESLDAARDAWPSILEEIRMRAGSLGQSVPQALFEAGRRAPAQWREAFAVAERDWQLTTDFGATTATLKAALVDSTADAVCETLLVAHELGGSDLDGRIADLVEDRLADLQARKEAAAKQAGVRFARRFVLLVPLGMALVGLSIGSGRSAYSSSGGQVAVIVGLLALAGCWVWSGRLLRVGRSPRVFG